MHYDTYFLDPLVAYEVAKQQNKIGGDMHITQVCYYDGKKIDSSLVNLIHLPLENMLDGLSNGIHRIPTTIDFTNIALSGDELEELKLFFGDVIARATKNRQERLRLNLHKLKHTSLDFKELLRFFIPANAATMVMQYVSKNVANELEKRGYSVYFLLSYGTGDAESFIDALATYNPHVVFNINHLNNTILGDDVFNFVWFQDAMDHLVDRDVSYNLRDRDTIFSLLPTMDRLLDIKKVPYVRQSFCANLDGCKHNQKIKREKKIVFIGSASVNELSNPAQNFQDALSYSMEIFLRGEYPDHNQTLEISKRFGLEVIEIDNLFYRIVRDMSVLWLCSIKTDYKIEVYGPSWDKYETVLPYYKGVLKYGEDIADVYSSATYALAPNSGYMLTQRVLEASACGAIPVVYDLRKTMPQEDYDEAFYYYSKLSDLEVLLKSDSVPNKNFDRLLSENSYGALVDKMLKIIKEKLDE